ncbi:DUF3037 domain-containing protein [Paenimyroides tangerinum]|uniref:DUF3037 domain-containing protein n=1 Tax=Paenimyroides tangerinum TaxID=2488728 RepID=A0A3P3W2S3_9FLAO|nr:DUF3037 domain-containing protein [Paenimyroides tangerinum]RRJ89412.1 DUF3037 domain-containing protein [Paenimyroides tangerinum]
MKNKNYTYSILKYKHSALIGESINIGIILFFPLENKFVFKYSKNLTRIKAIYEVVSEKVIKLYLQQIEFNIKNINLRDYTLFTHSDIENTEEFDLFIDNFILPRDSSVLQFSKSKESLYNLDLDTTILNITNKFLLEKDKNLNGGIIQKEPILVKKFINGLSKFNSDILTNNQDKIYKNYKVVNEAGNEFNFEYGWKNSYLNLIKAISFDLRDSRHIAEKAYKNFGLFTDLKNEAENNNLKYDLLIGLPTSKDLFKDFDHALNLLSNLERVDLILENDISDYSLKAFEAISN